MRYGLVWEDKVEELDKKDIIPLLRYVSTLSLPVLEDKPKNYLIEGDNYHALKALQFTYKSAIDVIYIDPPYNTGNNDFRYNDKIVDSEDGFRHSKWLSFMNKRLKLARELMSDDGVIFISIGDDEIAQLKMLMCKIFGDSNVETMIWHKEGINAGSGKMKITKRFRIDHEYILVAYRDKNKVNLNKPLEYTVTKNEYGNTDNDPRGNWISSEVCKSQAKSNEHGKNYYEVISPSGKVWERQWHFDYAEFNRLNADNRIYWGKDGGSTPRLKKFLSEKRPKTPTSVLNDRGTSSDGKTDFNNLNFTDSEFSYPKPVELIIHLVNLHVNSSATVLDFFAGSGTTGHAVMELNKEDGGQRSFILCTNNEVSKEIERNYMFDNNLITANTKIAYSKYEKDRAENPGAFDFRESPEYQALGIARAVTRERIKRVIEGYTTPKGKTVEALLNNLTYLRTHEFPRVLQRIGGAAQWQRGRKFIIAAASTRTARLARSR